jgi:hypothetical protein
VDGAMRNGYVLYTLCASPVRISSR